MNSLKNDNKLTIALCLLTLNEIAGCKHDIPLIDRNEFQQIFCLDGGSTDGTVEFLESEGITVYHQSEKGLNKACKEAVYKCSCDAIVFFHPKGTIPVEDIYKFRDRFDSGYDLIIASRMSKNSKNEEDNKLIKPRKWFGLFLSLLANIAFRREGNIILDPLHGFRGVRVDAFNKMEISDINPSVDIEMVCRSYILRMKRIEFATEESPRISGGASHFKAFPTGKILLKYLFWEITGGRNKNNEG